MPVIIVGSEKNFAALRPRLFSGSVSTKAAGEVSAAIDHYRQFILYMGPDQAAFAADVRTRLSALAARLK